MTRDPLGEAAPRSPEPPPRGPPNRGLAIGGRHSQLAGVPAGRPE